MSRAFPKNKIKCLNCKKEFHIKEKDFRPNKLAKKQIDNKIYLNEEELVFKEKIEESIQAFFRLFTLSKTKLDLECHEHFEEIRKQIEMQRDKINDICMEMIEATQKYEKSYLKNLNEKLDTCLNSFEIKSVDVDENQWSPGNAFFLRVRN